MKKYHILSLLAIMAIPLFLSSCLKDDDDETELTENCYISSVSLGTLKRSSFLTTAAGMDSVVTTSYSPTGFTMSIDQRALTIENHDSLPVHTRLTQVLTTIDFQGILMWRKAVPKEGDATEWTAYSKKDSLDLTEPVLFKVTSETGKSSRIYTLKVNVHQQNGDSTTWNNLGEVAVLEGLSNRKAFVWNDKLMVLGEAGGSLKCVQHALATKGDWSSTAVSGAEEAVPTTLQQMGGALYMSNTKGEVLTSTDAINWTTASMQAQEGLQLIGATEERLYALCNQKLLRSNGDAWEEEALDSDPANLPTTLLNTAFYTLPNGNQRLMLIGSRNDSDTKATVWAKGWGKDKEEEATWVYYTPNNSDKYHCPMLHDLCIVPYDKGLQALGGKSRDGKLTALEKILHSQDHGITWKPYDNNCMKVDDKLKSAARQSEHICAAVDNENFLWIVLDKQVWRGRINRLGFKK